MELKNYDVDATTTIAAIAQAPNGYHLSVVGGYIIETTGATDTVTLSIYDSGGILKSSIPFAVTANQRIEITTKIFLNQLETLKVVTATGTATVVLFGAETVKDSENIPDSWTWLGAWNSTTSYAINNLAENGGSTYICTTAHTNSEPPSANWELFASKGDNGSLTDIVQDTTPQLGGDLDAQGNTIVDCPVNRQAVGTSATTVTCDCSAYNWFAIEPTADIIINLTNVVAGTTAIIELVGAGDHTITWQLSSTASRITWDGGSEPTWGSGTDKSIGIILGYTTGYAFGALTLGEV